MESDTGHGSTGRTQTPSAKHKGRGPQSAYLLQTRAKGDRKREQFLENFARYCANKGLSEEQCHIEALKAALKTVRAGKLPAPTSADNLVAEARVAGHPEVRDEFTRLKARRDEAWVIEPALMRKTLFGPSQTLVRLLYLHREPDERHHTASVEAFLKYLRERFNA